MDPEAMGHTKSPIHGDPVTCYEIEGMAMGRERDRNASSAQVLHFQTVLVQ